MTARMWALCTSVLMDAVRRKVVWIVVFFGAVMAVAIPALPSYGVGVVEAVYREVALTLTYMATLVVTLALAANRIPAEVERRTVYNVLARDVRRWEYVVGTWAGVFLTVGAIVLAFTAIIIGVGWGVYGAPMWVLAEGTFAILLEAGAVAAFAVAVSTLSGPVIVSVSALVFVFVAHARGYLLTPQDTMYSLYPSLDPFNVINPIAHGAGVSGAYVGSMLVVFLAWVAVLLLIGVTAFGRRDL
ncbi:MAG: ABC transporter permease subunit [Coriobacteriia bacterium]|nr:ABC transporter permease subunit [Coriobacteriia bacterium]